MRKRLFIKVKLRPKNHYLTHYPEMILQFGLLIKVFTLRFESKHTFFKRAMRVLKCYKNITKTLSEKHKLLQTLLRSGTGLRYEQHLNEENEFYMNRYSDKIHKSILEANLNGKLTEFSSAIFRGNHYKKGDILAARQEAYQYNVQVGRIAIILCNNYERSHFILEVSDTTFESNLHLYGLGNLIGYECLSFDELLSYNPLHIYVQNTVSYVKLKHALVSTPLCSN